MAFVCRGVGLGGGGGGPCAAPPVCAAGGPVGRGVALPRSVPLPSLGRQQNGCHWRRSGDEGRGPDITPVRARPPSPGAICAASWRVRAGSLVPRGSCGSRRLGRGDGPCCGSSLGRGEGGPSPLPRGVRAGAPATSRPVRGVGGGRAAASLLPLWGAARGSLPWPPSCRQRTPPWRARSFGVAEPPRGGGGDEGRPVDRSPGGPFRPEPPSALPEWAMVIGGVMGGAASILFWCAALRRPQAWSARRSGALVWARPSAVTLAGAGGWGRQGARCAGPAASPLPRRGPFWGRGGVPSAPGGAEGRSCGPQAGGGSGGGGGWGAAPPPPAPRPVGRRPAISCLRRASPGYTRAVGDPGQPRASGAPRSAANGSVRRGRGGGGGVPPCPGSCPPPPQAGLRRSRSVCAVLGAAGLPSVRSGPGGSVRAVHRGRLPRPRCPLTPGAAASSEGVRGRRLFGLPPSALGPEGEGGGEWGGASSPLAPPPDGRGGAAWRSRPRGPAVGSGVALFPRPPLPRARPSCRPPLGPLVPPAVVARRWPAGGGHEG